MTLYIIGIGLNDEKDITVKGLEAVKKSEEVYLENYTSKLACSKEDLEKFYGKKIILADRELVEKKFPIERAKEKNISLLIIGDVFSATTHIAIYNEAKERGIEVEVIHNASIMNAIGVIGLELYKFGKTTSIPFDHKNIKAPIEVIKENKKLGLHTLVLLDLDPVNNKYLSIKEATQYLIKNNAVKGKEKIIGCSQIGNKKQKIIYAEAKELKEEFKPPVCIVIPGKLHFMEEETIKKFISS
jgi:diphthine synthase